MKKILALVLALITLLSCVSCIGVKVYEAEATEFSSQGLTLTLTKAFKKADVQGYTVAYDSAAVAVFALKESFSLMAGMSDMSVDDYAELLREANAARDPGAIQTEEGVLFFEYSFYNEEEKTTFKYFTTVHKGDDAFWMVQFATREGVYDEYRPYLLQWAKTVDVTAAD